MTAAASVIDEEVRRFDAIGAEWWDPAWPDGAAAPHQSDPHRLAARADRRAISAARRAAARGRWTGLTVLDIGCGAGLLAEPLSRLGRVVTGLEPPPTSIAIARAHAEATGAPATYGRARSRTWRARREIRRGAGDGSGRARPRHAHLRRRRGLAGQARRHDGALDPQPHAKSFALAIVGAEYVLRWLPPGTHHWEQFVTPDELEAALRDAGLVKPRRQGLVFEPLRRRWWLSRIAASIIS